MSILYDHERLNVFKKTRQLISRIYIVSRGFPKDEKFGLTQQIRRSSISILSNTVEGLSRRSIKEKIRFIELAYGSALELDIQILLSCDLNLITTTECSSFRNEILEIVKLLSGLRRSYISKN